tara:strand:- start:20203 stop:20355 length:153 start_codon:yes stop_codon:yes gene_type:complete
MDHQLHFKLKYSFEGGELVEHAVVTLVGACCKFNKSVALPNTTGLTERYP